MIVKTCDYSKKLDSSMICIITAQFQHSQHYNLLVNYDPACDRPTQGTIKCIIIAW